MSSTQPKNRRKKPAGAPSSKPLITAYHKKHFIVTTVILFSLFFLNYFHPVKGEETANVSNLTTEANLISPAGNNDDSWIDSDAATTISFTKGTAASSDGNPDQKSDYVILDGSGILAQNNPLAGLQEEVKTYTVKQGDTASGIAAMFNIDTNTILWSNGLKNNDLIKPGDQLTILSINGLRVKVAAKDTVASLAKKYSGKPEEIISYNMLSSDNLQVGSYVTIPNGKMPPSDHSNVTPIAGNWLMPNAYHNEGILSYSVRRGVGNGQCVAYAKSASGLTQYSGNAITWTRYVNSQTPQKGAVVVLNVGKYGHLAVVTNITDKTITVSEQNFIGRYIIDSRNLNINDSDILGYVTH